MLHRSCRFLYAASSVDTGMMYVSPWTTNPGAFMCRRPSENIAYELVPTSPSVPNISHFENHPKQRRHECILSSSRRAISTNIPDPLSPPLPIVHCFRQVFRSTSRIGTELLYVGSSWSFCLCSSI